METTAAKFTKVKGNTEV